MSNPYTIHHGDSLEILATMPDSSVDLILADPPFFKVKNEPWDKRWKTPDAFLDWLGQHFEQWQRVLRPNGSAFCFAWPKMAARVELKMAEFFNVLNRITWAKPSGLHRRACKKELRAYRTASEAILFGEHYGADNIAKGVAGYERKCDTLRGFVFEPLRAYLNSERERSGVTVGEITKAWQHEKQNKGGIVGHWFDRSQWVLPTEENYQWLRRQLSRLNSGDAYLRREYDDLRREYDDLRREYDDLRREYDDLRREYDDLRRPFNVTPSDQYTDVWTFKTVQSYPGKHPCEKPQSLLAHMIKTTTRPDAVVLDPFMGTGSTGLAAIGQGRPFIGIDACAEYVESAQRRLLKAALGMGAPVMQQGDLLEAVQ